MICSRNFALYARFPDFFLFLIYNVISAFLILLLSLLPHFSVSFFSFYLIHLILGMIDIGVNMNNLRHNAFLKC